MVASKALSAARMKRSAHLPPTGGRFYIALVGERIPRAATIGAVKSPVLGSSASLF
tara:strand:- start:449 stop:616 length:168 start_codon:yes stop_codon:yes gene_type:complete